MKRVTDLSFAVIIEKEGERYVALCPELDITSQGTSIENALVNLKEAVSLFLEAADPREVRQRRAHALAASDPLLALRGSGRALWVDEPADQYVRRLRETD